MFKAMFAHCPPRPLGRFYAVAAVAAALAIAAVNVAVSADYIRLQVDVKKSRELKNKVDPMLSNGFKGSSDQATFDEYYTKYVFAEWTDPASYSQKEDSIKIPRQKMLQDLARARQKPVYDRLNQLVLKQMQEFAKGNYHPATRYNAMVLIGQLNVDRVDFPALPTPLPETLPILLAAAQDASLPSAVQLGALLGVARHAEYGARDAESRAKITSLMLSVATSQTPPAGRSKAGHAWFRRLAIDALGRMGSAGQGGSVAKAIVDVMSETDAPLALRCDAAAALGRIKLTPQLGLDVATLAKAPQDLFLAVGGEEIRQEKEDATYVIDPSLLKARVTSVHESLAGAKGKGGGIRPLAAKPEDAAPIQEFQTDIAKLLGKEYLDHPDLAPKSEKQLAETGGPPVFGLGGEMGVVGPAGPGNLAGPALAGPGITGMTPVDPAKPILDAIMAELKRLVEKYEAK